MFPLRPWLAAVSLLVALPAIAQEKPPPPAPKTLADLAKEVKKEMDARKEKAINFGRVSGQTLRLTAGPGLAVKVRAAFEREKVAIDPDHGAKLTFNATYFQDEVEPKPGQKALTALKIDVKITDDRAKPVSTFDIFLTDEELILGGLQPPSVEIPPTPTPGPNHARETM